MPPPFVRAVAARDLAALKREFAEHEGPVPARVVVQAAGLGWKPGLAVLKKAGGDINASYRNYRPLHALIQEDPHAGGSSTPARVACLEWLLRQGADPELTGAWPAARAIVIAAFVGERSYVKTLLDGGARIDVFSASALGRPKRVEAFLARDAALAQARDGGLLTALQCCGGSRLGRTSARIATGLLDCARLLVDAGADVNAKTRSWGDDVAVSYFVVGSGQVEMLKLLLARGLDATAAVAPAAWDCRADIVDLLLTHGARLDAALDHERPILNELVRWGQFKQARMILNKGASPNVPDERGWTAIHQAVSRGNKKMLQDLIAAGGDASPCDRAGRTPRQLAAGRPELLVLLGQVGI